MANGRQNLSMKIIKSARKAFANTPVQKWPMTTYIYRKVFRYGYSEDELTIDFRGVKLTIPTKDTTIVPGLVGGFYEKIELDVFERLAATSKVILDVGGSIGDYTTVGASKLPDGGMIYAFEPIPENVAYINNNLEQNHLTHKAVVTSGAVGDVDGEIDIYTVDGSVGTHSAASKSAAGISKTSVKVPMISLDSFIAEHKISAVDILKIDIEGYDGFALRGAKHLVDEHKPTVFIEFVTDNLINCGFEPQEFLDILLRKYQNVFVVDEPKERLNRYDREELEQLSKRSMNVNFIVTDRPEHLKIINEWI